ncbi:MAG: hypothetical protein GY791_08290 [Alphaproteobacteria bacterium]|nr:hypothetical protein [Alphaproteobacteria bacterium]
MTEPTDTAPVTTETATTPAADPPQWVESLDGGARELVAAKGWSAPGDVVQSYINLEKLMGADRSGRTVIPPKEGDAPEAFDAFYDRIGRPESAEDYLMPDAVVRDATVDAELADWGRRTLHTAGLSQGQFDTVVTAWNEMMAERLEAEARNRTLAVNRDDNVLRQEWGDRYDAKMALAKRAARAVPGAVADVAAALDAIESDGAPGRAGVFRLFAWLGENLIEDKLAGEGEGEFGHTSDAARRNIAALKLDEAFQRALLSASHPGPVEARAKWDRLHEAAHG